MTTSEAELADIARTIAQQSIVLLRNERGTLPLKRTTAVALIGEFAENPRFQGGGSSNVQVASFTTARKEIRSFPPPLGPGAPCPRMRGRGDRRGAARRGRGRSPRRPMSRCSSSD
ncbi:glycoside hydrolase family 3 C-terminal domain-containing protein [Streptomyces echinatus]|uniref:glycoside hydrolase family 3 C-terminal domain-containing protein n=1 Tax=Streptomyces echinatus TaxID=67293 RepID=UPI0031E74A68